MPDTIDSFLQAKFARAGFAPPGRILQDILIAGCGTGQRSIAMAQKFGASHMLAVDLSLASLGYARRKAGELGLPIVHGQADILEIESLGRQFDLIESLGVLHHLADPWDGWRRLLSVLRPGGVMLLGLYSESARRPVVEARARLAGLEGADAIRDARQILAGDAGPSILGSEDFFSLSGARDLLFHVQEHRTTLPEIARFLESQSLRFLGFELDEAVLAAYRRRFPQDRPATDLALWDRFETGHPGLFGGMYIFWVQKTA
jgi:SAM-dependent methyltransferase